MKILNLRSVRLPTPPLLSAVHIDRVDDAAFFGWTRDGVLQMPGQDHVPQLQVVHYLSCGMNLTALRAGEVDLAAPADAVDRAPPVTADQAAVAALAWQWTQGEEPGWPQVEAIVQRLRTSFEHDPAATAPEECGDVVAHFLATGRGPDYLFASAAAILLRHLGYSTRIVSGFYASPSRYDRAARQTVVLPEDLHFWTEVRAGDTWVPLEPTPGSLPPPETLTWGQWASLHATAAARWVQRNGVLLAVAGLAALVLAALRRQAEAAASWLIWRVAAVGSWRRRVLWTVWLLERRAVLAGRARPKSRTLASWYAPLSGEQRGGDLGPLLRMAERALYADDRTTPEAPFTNDEIHGATSSAAQYWTLARLRQLPTGSNTSTTAS